MTSRPTFATLHPPFLYNQDNITMQPHQIRQRIEAGLSDCTALVSGEDGVHFTATVISPDFAGKTRIQAQKMVYATLEDYLRDGSLHALALTTLTPDAWQEKQHG